jgi:tetratricopeptide (TPR) repeat protein
MMPEPSTSFDRGMACLERKEFDHAIAEFTAAIGLDPRHAPSFYNRGVAYGRLGFAHASIEQLDRAVHDYSEAIRLNPDYAHAYTNRAGIYHYKSDLEGSKQHYRDALADYAAAIALTDDGFAIFNRGGLYRALGELENALADFSTVIARDPGDGDAFEERARVYEQMGRPDLARVDRQQAERLRAGSP